MTCDDTQLPDVALPYVIDPVSGPRAPATCVDDAGVGTQAWTAPGNAVSSNNVRASAALTAGEISQWLKCTGFGFSPTNLPPDAVISSVNVESERYASNTNVKDNAARLVKGGVIQSTDAADAATYPVGAANESFASHVFSSFSGWKHSDFYSLNFGAALSVVNTSTSPGTRTAYVDSIRLTISYSLPAGHQDASGFEVDARDEGWWTYGNYGSYTYQTSGCAEGSCVEVSAVNSTQFGIFRPVQNLGSASGWRASVWFNILASDRVNDSTLLAMADGSGAHRGQHFRCACRPDVDDHGHRLHGFGVYGVRYGRTPDWTVVPA